MIVMVINSGSSSLKYQAFDMDSGNVLAKGICERIGIDGVLTHGAAGHEKIRVDMPLKNHRMALEAAMEHMTSPVYGAVGSLRDIGAVGHRIAHGGSFFSDSTLIGPGVKEGIRACIPLAPLHNPAALMGIEACEEVLGKDTPQVAVCDTAFHQTIPFRAYTYGIPYALSEKHHIRRYGFHGISHQYVSRKAAEWMGKNAEETDLIVCHLGNGASVAAIKGGKSVDTSMGFTSLEGVMMGTRCGDLDPAIVPFLIAQEGMTAAEAEKMLYQESGVLGVSGVSPDLRDVERAAREGDARAQSAIDLFCYRIRKYIGAYLAVLGGADAIVFTAGVGENSALTRRRTLEGLERIGVSLDDERNESCAGGPARISADYSPIQALVIPTDEEWVIASDTKRLAEERAFGTK